jgi:ubiquinone/menaquinone biosynthesis C-methylase UbiE
MLNMTPSNAETNPSQRLVDNLFDIQATYWKETYQDKDIQGIIYQQRQTVALSYVDGLSLPRSTRVLEIGCGAGYLAVALAKRGFTVEAIDHTQVMVNLTMKHAKRTGNLDRINAHTGDAHKLNYPNGSFDLVVALGVVPWLYDLKKALSEIVRILAPNGYAILTADNSLRATTLFDPMTFPAMAELQRSLRYRLERAGLLTSRDCWKNAPPYRQHSPKNLIKTLHRLA